MIGWFTSATNTFGNIFGNATTTNYRRVIKSRTNKSRTNKSRTNKSRTNKSRTLRTRVDRKIADSATGDFVVDIDNANEFFEWYADNINLYPLYVCPCAMSIPFTPSIKPLTEPLTEQLTEQLTGCIRFGVGYKVVSNSDRLDILRSCMEKTYSLGGDMLRDLSIFKNEEDFWKHYTPADRHAVAYTKAKYDPYNRFYTIGRILTLHRSSRLS
jgi:hypothetical protein